MAARQFLRGAKGPVDALRMSFNERPDAVLSIGLSLVACVCSGLALMRYSRLGEKTSQYKHHYTVIRTSDLPKNTNMEIYN